MKISIIVYTALFIVLFTTACSTQIPAPVKIKTSSKRVDFIDEVKPILDKRCVSCHSCYNSPCQAKLSSFEGIDRGGSKDVVYNALRLDAQDPTRLFIDAQTTKGWRKKGFFSITEKFDANESYNDSIMMHLLYDKKMHPEIVGAYAPESDKLICPKDKEELGEYLEDKPNHGMPYGFPPLKDDEYETLTQWIAQGAKGPTPSQQHKLTTPSKNAQKEIIKWEKFLNNPDAKHTLTARYLYEHLFLAHWHFSSAPDEYFEIVRSRTPYPQDIDLIVTLRPYDDPEVDKFYYRLRKIHSTIVHKTHMVVEFNDEKLKEINKLFIDVKWMNEPHYVDYDSKRSANPFLTFFQIPTKSRYQFLLNNSHYVVMTFIRGPVCRGQIALNVIHDHFWVMFVDPEYDVSVKRPALLLEQAQNLSMPIETSSESILETFSDKYRIKYHTYFNEKQNVLQSIYPDGMGIESIWKGNKPTDAPLLSIYRHFDSASVHRGVIGELPRTMWVIDYPQFERIYYSLVAGYDVFGNISHQTNIRRYMDFLRLEGEINFLQYMPQEQRISMLESWYIGTDIIKDMEEKSLDKYSEISFARTKTKINFQTEEPKQEFITKVVDEHILKSTGIEFDKINYFKIGEKTPTMPKSIITQQEIVKAVRSLTAPGTGFIKNVTGGDVNILLLRVIMKDGTSHVYSIIVNRWHNNVNSMFRESSTLDSSKDTLDFIPGYIGSYPNAFAVVHYKDLPEFIDIVENYKDTDEYNAKFAKYFIGRSHKNFWETFDWFQNDFTKKEPIQSGLLDLNRYYHR
jgi:hypothetical protein